MYDYVKKAYGVDPVVGARVYHNDTKKHGVITRESSQGHYVQVRFDNRNFSVPCHPTDLNYTPNADGAT